MMMMTTTMIMMVRKKTCYLCVSFLFSISHHYRYQWIPQTDDDDDDSDNDDGDDDDDDDGKKGNLINIWYSCFAYVTYFNSFHFIRRWRESRVIFSVR